MGDGDDGGVGSVVRCGRLKRSRPRFIASRVLRDRE